MKNICNFYLDNLRKMGAGILPVALYRGTLFLLLGQERHNSLWSDFGGSSNKGEKPFKKKVKSVRLENVVKIINNLTIFNLLNLSHD